MDREAINAFLTGERKVAVFKQIERLEVLAALPRANTLVCRCEDVAHSDLQQRSGWIDAKLHTRCGMGACQDCLVTVDGTSGVRACLTPVRAGMDVTTSEAGRG